MQLCTAILPTLEENLALDEALLLQAEAEPEQAILRLWHWSQLAVVLGAAGKVTEDVCVEQCETDGVSIARRSSGGGTVLLGPGCFLFSLILPYSYDECLSTISGSYTFIMNRMCRSLDGLGQDVRLCGTSDLAVDGRKVSGNSQQRKRLHLLHHGTLLYQFPIAQVGRYLQSPVRQPDYREQRPHEEFLANLQTDERSLRERLISAWNCDSELSLLPTDRVEPLVQEKYSLREWTFRR